MSALASMPALQQDRLVTVKASLLNTLSHYNVQGGSSWFERRPGRSTVTGDVLRVEGLRVDLGGRRVSDDVTLRVGSGELVGFIGPNGSGNTTLLRAVSRLVPAQGGYGRATRRSKT